MFRERYKSKNYQKYQIIDNNLHFSNKFIEILHFLQNIENIGSKQIERDLTWVKFIQIFHVNIYRLSTIIYVMVKHIYVDITTRKNGINTFSRECIRGDSKQVYIDGTWINI